MPSLRSNKALREQARARPPPNLVVRSATLHWRLGLAGGLAPLVLPAAVTEATAQNADADDSALRASHGSIREVDSAATPNKGKLHFMCKTMMPAMQGSPIVDHVFKTEDVVYSSILPAMENVAQMQEPLPWPRGYRSLPRDPSMPPCLAMDDLRSEGFVMATRGMVLDEMHCRFVLSATARFHGAGMALQHLRPNEFAEFQQQLQNDVIIESIREMLKTLFKTAECIPDMVTDRFPEGTSVHDKLKKLLSNFSEDCFNYMVPHEAGGNTFVHGDCHINNVMFQYDKASGRLTDCRLIDFQAVRYGSPALDLVYMLLPCTEKAMRDKHWDALMQGYFTELHDTLRAAGCKEPDAIYSWDMFQEQMRRASVIGLGIAPLMIHNLNDDGAVQEVQATVARMTGANGKEHDDGEVSATPKPAGIVPKATSLLKTRLGNLVESLLQWGWL